MQHIAIMKKSWGLTEKILNGQKKIESRWYCMRRAPWDKIKADDIIFFKDSGNPVSVKAKVEKVIQFSDLTPEKVKNILTEYGDADGIEKDKIPEFFERFKNKKYCLLIFLKNPQKIKPYWMSQGELSGGIIILVVRNGKKYFATNDLTLTKKEILSLYKRRWLTETVFQMLHSKLGLDQCESRSLRSQTAHFCLLAYIVLEKEKFITSKTVYQTKRDCSFDFKKADNLLNKLIFQSA